MNKPLKGKQYAETMGEPSHMVYFHIDEDIKSAVEWLKEEISKLSQSENIINKLDTITLINKAFKDVTLNSGKEGEEK